MKSKDKLMLFHRNYNHIFLLSNRIIYIFVFADSGSDISTVLQNWKDRMEFVKKLLTLLNSFTPPEIRQISIGKLGIGGVIFFSRPATHVVLILYDTLCFHCLSICQSQWFPD